jgi:hypothetical protein
LPVAAHATGSRLSAFLADPERNVHVARTVAVAGRQLDAIDQAGALADELQQLLERT